MGLEDFDGGKCGAASVGENVMKRKTIESMLMIIKRVLINSPTAIALLSDVQNEFFGI